MEALNLVTANGIVYQWNKEPNMEYWYKHISSTLILYYKLQYHSLTNVKKNNLCQFCSNNQLEPIASRFIIVSGSHLLVLFPFHAARHHHTNINDGINHTYLALLLHNIAVTSAFTTFHDSIQDFSCSYKVDSLLNLDKILSSGWAAMTETQTGI